MASFAVFGADDDLVDSFAGDFFTVFFDVVLDVFFDDFFVVFALMAASRSAASRHGRVRSAMAKFKTILTLATLILACPLMQACATGGAASRAVEPTAIAVQNATTQTFATVAISEAVEGAAGARMGRIEPLTRGTTSVIQRQTNARPLANRIHIEWTTADGQNHDSVVEIGHLLDLANSESGDTLLFEIAETAVRARLVWGAELNPF